MGHLTVMTQQWTQFVHSIMLYLISEREKDEDRIKKLAAEPTQLFNSWARARGQTVNDPDLALWCVDYICRMVKMPLGRLKLAAELDGLKTY